MNHIGKSITSSVFQVPEEEEGHGNQLTAVRVSEETKKLNA